MAEQGKPPTAAEFQHWLKPEDALARLPEEWGRGHCVAAIVTHLKVGGIRAVARRGLIGDNGDEPVEFYTLLPEYWDEGRWVAGPEALWVTGQVSFHRGSRLKEMLGHPPETWLEHMFTGVRFDPVDFEREFAGDLPPKAAKFSDWLTPAAALAAVPDDIAEPERKRWIMRRLQGGQIRAVAETMIVSDINGREEVSYEIIEPRFWKMRDTGDWFSSGDLEATDAPEVNSAGERISIKGPWHFDPEKVEVTRFTVATFLGVRLDPAGFPARPTESPPPTIYLPAPPSPEDFEQWWFPCNALDSFLSLGEDQAKDAVRSLLTAGAIPAAAVKLILDGEVLGLSGIPKEVWPAVRSERFWSTDFFEIRIGKSSLTAFGVKLDPEAILRHAPPAPPPRPPADVSKYVETINSLFSDDASTSPPPQKPATKRLSDGRLAAWAEMFFAGRPDASEAEARQSLGVLFPENTVSRARLREVMPRRRRGRPLKPKEEK